jgi:Protein of unknown function (DUF2384)
MATGEWELADPQAAASLKRKQILAKAVLRAASALGLNQGALADILGMSTASVSRMKEGGYLLGQKEFELAAFLVRIYRSLDAQFGGDPSPVRSWFHAENRHLGGTPALLVKRIEGLVRVSGYLDFMRGAQ